jgi:hypothetical protein
MSLPTHIGAYDDCRDIFERATLDPKGARAKAGTHEAATSLRTRLHYFRTLDRRANAGVYASDHPMHGRSLYDGFMVELIRDEDSDWWAYVTPRRDKILALEGLSEVGDLLEESPDVQA